MKLQKDTTGLFGVVEGCKARPLPSTQDEHFTAWNGMEFDKYGHVIRADNNSSLRKGATVSTTHINGTMLLRVNAPGIKELWFLHEEGV